MCDFAKFLKTPFFTEHLQWLFLKINLPDEAFSNFDNMCIHSSTPDTFSFKKASKNSSNFVRCRSNGYIESGKRYISSRY